MKHVSDNIQSSEELIHLPTPMCCGSISRAENPQTKIRRVCFYAGSGCGKTTSASGLFAELKRDTVANKIDFQLELIQEYVKVWAWEKRKIESFDQNFIFANQQHLEDVPLRNGVDCIITDSPLLLSAAYARKTHVKSWQALITLAELHEEAYPGLHIFLERGERPYVPKGRYEDKDRAVRMDGFIRGMLDLFIGNDRYAVMPYDDFDGICNLVRDKLGLLVDSKEYTP